MRVAAPAPAALGASAPFAFVAPTAAQWTLVLVQRIAARAAFATEATAVPSAPCVWRMGAHVAARAICWPGSRFSADVVVARAEVCEQRAGAARTSS